MREPARAQKRVRDRKTPPRDRGKGSQRSHRSVAQRGGGGIAPRAQTVASRTRQALALGDPREVAFACRHQGAWKEPMRGRHAPVRGAASRCAQASRSCGRRPAASAAVGWAQRAGRAGRSAAGDSSARADGDGDSGAMRRSCADRPALSARAGAGRAISRSMGWRPQTRRLRGVRRRVACGRGARGYQRADNPARRINRSGGGPRADNRGRRHRPRGCARPRRKSRVPPGG